MLIQRFGDDGAVTGGGVDHTRIIRQELDASERELAMVKSELSEKERLLERERTNTDIVRHFCTLKIHTV